MAIKKSISDAAKKLKPGESLMSIPGVTKRADADKAPITLDKKGVETFAGEKSSDKSNDPERIRDTATSSASNTKDLLAQIAKLEKTSIAADGKVFAGEKRKLKALKEQLAKTQNIAPAQQTAVKTGIAEFRERETLAGKAVKILTSGKTTAVLASVAAVLTGVYVLGGAAAATTAGTKAATSGSRAVVSRAVYGHEYVHTFTGGTRLVPRGAYQAQRGFIGKPGTSGVNKLFKLSGNAASRVAMNTKTARGTATVLGRRFSPRALAFAGAWAGSVFLGRWGEAEAAEPISIPLRDALKQAKETGDWSLYDEYKTAADEITNLSIWEQILLWSPIAAVKGSLDKLKGVKKGIQLINAIATKEKEREPEESFEDSSKRIAGEKREKELQERTADEDYYKRLSEESDQRKRDERKEQEDYYSGIRAKQDEADKKKRQEDAEYWDAIYNKNKERDEKDRAADEAYWDNIYKENEARKSKDTTTSSKEKQVTLYNKSTGKKWVGASNLAFGLLSSGGYYEEEEYFKEKKKGGK